MDSVQTSPINSWSSREFHERKSLSDVYFKNSQRRNSVGSISDNQNVKRQSSHESTGTERIGRRNSMPQELDVDSFEAIQEPNSVTKKQNPKVEIHKFPTNKIDIDELLAKYFEQQNLIEQLSDELVTYKEAVRRLLKERKRLVSKLEKIEIEQIEKERELHSLAKTLLLQKQQLDEQLAHVALKVDKIEQTFESKSSPSTKKKRFSLSFSKNK